MRATPVPLSEAPQDPRVARSRAKMLAAATELLIEAGARGVTVDAVAERSGVAKSTLYRHWSSIHELLVDVMRSNVPEPISVDLDSGFEAALRTWVARAVAALSAPDWARTLPALLELRLHSPEMKALLDADFDNKLETVARILELGSAEGQLHAGLDPRQLTHMLIGPLVLAALTGDEATMTDLAEHVVERFLRSYRTDSTGALR
ncbi:MAG: TetR/AcrR family transcriptional regulator [Actinobacteria bacterium]|nr:TetR/AcrR family transcriptional regulator [Actinomycetota bacterium]